jgi:hypothetical protein
MSLCFSALRDIYQTPPLFRLHPFFVRKKTGLQLKTTSQTLSRKTNQQRSTTDQIPPNTAKRNQTPTNRTKHNNATQSHQHTTQPQQKQTHVGFGLFGVGWCWLVWVDVGWLWLGWVACC